MNDDRLQRRLAAILYADMEGYSRLASEDEDANISYNAACLYCKVDLNKKALFYLELSLQTSPGYIISGWVKNDSDLDPLRALPEFKRIMNSYLSSDQ